VKSLVIDGKVRRWWDTNAYEQDGECGWSKAHERRVIAGCAEFVSAVVRESGLVAGGFATLGMSMGEVKEGHFRLDIEAILSRILTLVGHESAGAQVFVRCWI